MLISPSLQNLNGNSLAGGLPFAPAANGNSLAGGDLSNLSEEGLNGTNDSGNPQILQVLYESKLRSGIDSINAAKAKGEDPKEALESLSQTYGEAKEKNVPISSETESQVKQLLGLEGGSEGGGGNTDALNQGGDLGGGGDDGGGMGGGGGGGCDGGGGCNGCNGGGGGGGGDYGGPPANLTEEDKKFLNQAITSESEHFKDLFGGWRQGAEGNCSTVAAIKAAMDRYDNQVFDSVTRGENGYNITMQDGYKMSLSDQELAMGKAASNFRGNDGVAKSYAQFLYSAAAKRNALENGMSLRASFNDLNNGESIYSPGRLLGLKHQMVRVNPRNLSGQDSVVAGSHRHAVFINKNANGSHTTDRYGRGVNFNGTDTWGNGLTDAYTFKPRAFSAGGSRGGSSGGGGGTTPRSAPPRAPRPVTTTRRSR